MNLQQLFTFPEAELIPFALLNEEQQFEVWRMRNHPEIARWMGSGGDIPLEHHLAFMARQGEDRANFNYLGRDAAGTLGVVSLHRLDVRNRSAWLGVYRNPFRTELGLGTRLMKAIARLAFDVARINSIKLEVVVDNEAAIGAYRRFGFCEEGRLREAVYRENGYTDMLLMGLLAREWTSK